MREAIQEEKPYLLVFESKRSKWLENFQGASEKYTMLFAENAQEAIAKLRRFEPGVVLHFESERDERLNTLKEMVLLAPHTKIILVTEHPDRKMAIQAIHAGAYDYYVKPVNPAMFNLMIERAFYLHTLEKEHKQSIDLSIHSCVKGVMTSNPVMQKVCRTVQKVAPNNITILLLGESGTGKEVLAHALHENSDRAKGPFVAINCAAIPETLLESELFGYEKGAFTGAVKQMRGKIEMAHKGTLFLDEIGDLPLSLQPKLLRFLQERVIERLGGRMPLPVDVRVVCATHHNLQESIQSHAFREDLYYRLSEVSISIPPLRERLSDLALMARELLIKFAKEYKRPVKKFSEEALHAIHHYAWPGNVRELENKIKCAVIMAEGSQVTLADLDLPIKKTSPLPFNLKQIREGAEKEAVIRAIHYCDGNVSKTAELLGVTRPTLYHLMEKLSIYAGAEA